MVDRLASRHRLCIKGLLVFRHPECLRRRAGKSSTFAVAKCRCPHCRCPGYLILARSARSILDRAASRHSLCIKGLLGFEKRIAFVNRLFWSCDICRSTAGNFVLLWRISLLRFTSRRIYPMGKTGFEKTQISVFMTA